MMKKTIIYIVLILGCLMSNAQSKDTLQTHLLKEVTVQGNQLKRYHDTLATLATRLPVKMIETPQAIQVISKDLMQDQQSMTLNELLKNATGVSNATPKSDYSIRGFTSYNMMMYNGVNGSLFPYNVQTPMFNIQEVEILRGPAAILYGTANPGGLINLVTKKPLDHERFEANVIYGSWNEKSIQLDQTNVLTKDKKWAYRVIVNATDKESFRNFRKTKQIFVTPSLIYKPNEKTAINLEYNYFHVNSKGSGWDDGTLVRLKPDGSYDWSHMPVDFSVQSPNDKTIDYGHTIDLGFKHEFTKNISLNFLNRYIYQYEIDKTHYYDNAEPAHTNDTIHRLYQAYDFASVQYQSSLFNLFKFKTGKIQHKLIVGFDYSKVGIPKYTNKTAPASDLNINNPDYSNDYPTQDFVQITNNFSNLYTSVAGYVQEYIELGKFKLSAGLRFDDYNQKTRYDYVDYTVDPTVYQVRDTIKSHAWVPKIGLVYNPKDNVGIYANYTESFEPQSVNSAAQGGPFAPLTGKTYETGVKIDFLNKKISTVVDFFNIEYKNMLVPDLEDTSGVRYKAIDGYNSRGIELNIQGKITDELAVVANYSYNEVKYFETNDQWSRTDRQVNVPKDIYGAFVSYSPKQGKLKNLSVNGGFHHEGNRVAAWGNQQYVAPAFTTFDAGLNYGYKNFKIYLNLNNITDTRYVTGGYSSGLAFAGAPRNFRVTLNYILDKK